MPRSRNRFINWVQGVNTELRRHAPVAANVIRTLHRAPAENIEVQDAWTFAKHGPEYFVADKDAAPSSTDIVWGRWFVG